MPSPVITTVEVATKAVVYVLEVSTSYNGDQSAELKDIYSTSFNYINSETRDAIIALIEHYDLDLSRLLSLPNATITDITL